MCSAVCGVKHSVMNSKHSVLRIGSVPPTFVKRDCTQIDYLDLELSRDKCWEETIPPGDSAPRLRASYVDSDRISACFSTQVNQICPVTVRTMPDQLVQLPRDQLRQWVFNSPQKICAVSLISSENKTVDGFKHRKNEQNVDEMGFEEENCIRHVAPVKADSKEETKSDGGVPSQNGTTEVHAVGAVTGATEVLSRNTSPDSYTSVNTCGQCHKEGDERLELKNTLDLSSLQLCAIESHGEVRKAHELINEVTPRTCPSAEDDQRGNIHTKQDITPPAWPSGIQTEPNTVPETPMELGKNMNPSEVANVESGTTELLPSRESYVSEENAHRHPQGISQEFQKDGAHRVFWSSAEPRSNIGQGEADDKTERFSCILQDSPATCLSCSSGQIQKLSESDQNEFEIDNLGSLGVDKSWDFPLGENNHLMSEKAIWLSPLVYPYGHFQAAKDGDMFTDPSSVPISPPKCKKSEDTTMFTSCKPTDQSRGHKETYLRKEKTDSEDGDTYENEVDCIEESCLISPTLDKTLEKQTANFETKYASREVVLNHGIRKLIPRTAYLQRSFISQSNAGIENGRGSTDVHYISKLEGEKVFELAEEKTADQLHKSLDCKSGAAVERCSDVVRQDPAAVDRCVIDQAKQAANTEMLKAPDDTWIWDCLHLSRIATQQILNLQKDEPGEDNIDNIRHLNMKTRMFALSPWTRISLLKSRPPIPGPDTRSNKAERSSSCGCCDSPGMREKHARLWPQEQPQRRHLTTVPQHTSSQSEKTIFKHGEERLYCPASTVKGSWSFSSLPEPNLPQCLGRRKTVCPIHVKRKARSGSSKHPFVLKSLFTRCATETRLKEGEGGGSRVNSTDTFTDKTAQNKSANNSPNCNLSINRGKRNTVSKKAKEKSTKLKTRFKTEYVEIESINQPFAIKNRPLVLDRRSEVENCTGAQNRNYNRSVRVSFNEAMRIKSSIEQKAAVERRSIYFSQSRKNKDREKKLNEMSAQRQKFLLQLKSYHKQDVSPRSDAWDKKGTKYSAFQSDLERASGSENSENAPRRFTSSFQLQSDQRQKRMSSLYSTGAPKRMSVVRSIHSESSLVNTQIENNFFLHNVGGPSPFDDEVDIDSEFQMLEEWAPSPKAEVKASRSKRSTFSSKSEKKTKSKVKYKYSLDEKHGAFSTRKEGTKGHILTIGSVVDNFGSMVEKPSIDSKLLGDSKVVNLVTPHSTLPSSSAQPTKSHAPGVGGRAGDASKIQVNKTNSVGLQLGEGARGASKTQVKMPSPQPTKSINTDVEEGSGGASKTQVKMTMRVGEKTGESDGLRSSQDGESDLLCDVCDMRMRNTAMRKKQTAASCQSCGRSRARNARRGLTRVLPNINAFPYITAKPDPPASSGGNKRKHSAVFAECGLQKVNDDVEKTARMENDSGGFISFFSQFTPGDTAQEQQEPSGTAGEAVKTHTERQSADTSGEAVGPHADIQSADTSGEAVKTHAERQSADTSGEAVGPHAERQSADTSSEAVKTHADRQSADTSSEAVGPHVEWQTAGTAGEAVKTHADRQSADTTGEANTLPPIKTADQGSRRRSSEASISSHIRRIRQAYMEKFSTSYCQDKYKRGRPLLCTYNNYTETRCFTAPKVNCKEKQPDRESCKEKQPDRESCKEKQPDRESRNVSEASSTSTKRIGSKSDSELTKSEKRPKLGAATCDCAAQTENAEKTLAPDKQKGEPAAVAPSIGQTDSQKESFATESEKNETEVSALSKIYTEIPNSEITEEKGTASGGAMDSTKQPPVESGARAEGEPPGSYYLYTERKYKLDTRAWLAANPGYRGAVPAPRSWRYGLCGAGSFTSVRPSLRQYGGISSPWRARKRVSFSSDLPSYRENCGDSRSRSPGLHMSCPYPSTLLQQAMEGHNCATFQEEYKAPVSPTQQLSNLNKPPAICPCKKKKNKSPQHGLEAKTPQRSPLCLKPRNLNSKLNSNLLGTQTKKKPVTVSGLNRRNLLDTISNDPCPWLISGIKSSLKDSKHKDKHVHVLKPDFKKSNAKPRSRTTASRFAHRTENNCECENCPRWINTLNEYLDDHRPKPCNFETRYTMALESQRDDRSHLDCGSENVTAPHQEMPNRWGWGCDGDVIPDLQHRALSLHRSKTTPCVSMSWNTRGHSSRYEPLCSNIDRSVFHHRPSCKSVYNPPCFSENFSYDSLLRVPYASDQQRILPFRQHRPNKYDTAFLGPHGLNHTLSLCNTKRKL